MMPRVDETMINSQNALKVFLPRMGGNIGLRKTTLMELYKISALKA